MAIESIARNTRSMPTIVENGKNISLFLQQLYNVRETLGKKGKPIQSNHCFVAWHQENQKQ